MNFLAKREYRTAAEWRDFWRRGAAVIAYKKFEDGEWWLDYVWPDAQAVWHCKISAADAKQLGDLLGDLRESKS